MTSDAWDNEYVTEHVALWVRWLQAEGLEPEAIRGEIDRWSLDDVTQVCVGQHAAQCRRMSSGRLLRGHLGVNGPRNQIHSRRLR